MSIFDRIDFVVALLHGRAEGDDGDKGAAMVEYAILVAGMALVVAAAVVLLGDRIQGFVSGINI